MAVGGLGGGVLVPWSLNKLRGKSPETVNIAQTPSSVPSATRTEDTPTDPKLTENPSIEVLKVPQQAPDSRPPQEVDETGNCTILNEVPEEMNDWFWNNTSEGTEKYVTVSCEDVINNPLISANTWGGLFPEGVFSTMRSFLQGKKFDIKMEVTPTETGLNDYTVIFDGKNKFNNLVTGKWDGKEEESQQKTFKIISISTPTAIPDKIYIWSN